MSELFQYGATDGYRTRGISLGFSWRPIVRTLGFEFIRGDGDAYFSVGFIFGKLTLAMYRVFPPRAK